MQKEAEADRVGGRNESKVGGGRAYVNRVETTIKGGNRLPVSRWKKAGGAIEQRCRRAHAKAEGNIGGRR